MVLTQKETAKRCRVSEFSVVAWNRRRELRQAVAQILDEMNEPLTPRVLRVLRVLRALAVKAIMGSPKHTALYLRGVGRLDNRYSNHVPGGAPRRTMEWSTPMSR